MSRQSVVVFVLLFVLAATVYHAAWHAPYYADDYQTVFTNPREAIFNDFFHPSPTNQWYRPLQTMVLATIQLQYGWETLPIRIIHLLFLTATAWLVFSALRWWGIAQIGAIFAAVFVIVAQSCVDAVAGNDTFSQVSGTFFSALALWWLYRYGADKPRAHWRYVGSVLLFFLALLSKETSAGLAFGIAFILLFAWGNLGWKQRIRKALVPGLPFVAASIGYWLLRANASAITPEIGGSTYMFSFGLNIPINVSMLAFQSLLPVSSFEFIRQVYTKEFFTAGLSLAFTLTFIVLVVFALRKTPHRPLVRALLVLTLCSWFPVVILARIIELYAYNAVPYVGALVGIAADYYWMRRAHRRVSTSLALAGIGVAVLVVNILSTNAKALSMKRMGDRAEVLFPQIIDKARSVPPGERLYMVNPKDSSFEYALFAVHGFRVCTCMDSLVRFYSGRPDINYLAENAKICYARSLHDPGPAYSYDPQTLRVYPLPGNVIDTTWVVGRK